MLSRSRRNDKISDTKEACKVGVKRLGSKGDIPSSKAFWDSLLRFLAIRASAGRGGGVDEGDMSSNSRDRRDSEEDGVLYGVPVGDAEANEGSRSMFSVMNYTSP